MHLGLAACDSIRTDQVDDRQALTHLRQGITVSGWSVSDDRAQYLKHIIPAEVWNTGHAGSQVYVHLNEEPSEQCLGV